MRNLFLLFLVVIVFACKKNNSKNVADVLNETHWNLYYKNNNTFNFYAQSQLYFKQNKIVDNYRNFDTVIGNWNLSLNIITINFNNGGKYTGTIITNDSIVGTLITAGNNGVWYAIR